MRQGSGHGMGRGLGRGYYSEVKRRGGRSDRGGRRVQGGAGGGGSQGGGRRRRRRTSDSTDTMSDTSTRRFRDGIAGRTRSSDAITIVDNVSVSDETSSMASSVQSPWDKQRGTFDSIQEPDGRYRPLGKDFFNPRVEESRSEEYVPPASEMDSDEENPKDIDDVRSRGRHRRVHRDRRCTSISDGRRDDTEGNDGDDEVIIIPSMSATNSIATKIFDC